MLSCAGQVKEISGGDPATTNNRMELQAAISALALLKEPCEVECFTDSVYVRDGITKWLLRWKANGWRTTARKPVSNDDLWRALDLAAQPHQLTWRWLKGHAGHEFNERCDRLAAVEIQALKRTFTPAELREKVAAFKAARASLSQTGLLL